LEERITTTPALALSAPAATQKIAGARKISFFIMDQLSRRFPSAYRDFSTGKWGRAETRISKCELLTVERKKRPEDKIRSGE
jgi:hypothetical protein